MNMIDNTSADSDQSSERIKPVTNRSRESGHIFEHRHQEIGSSLDNSGTDQAADSATRKSTLVEIPTATARVIYKIQAIFPLDLFPDEMIIDEIKVSVMYRSMLTRQIYTILIKDITDIIFSSNLIFGALQITGGDYQTNNANDNGKGPLTISNLWSKEAQTARRIILGLMIFSDQKVDTTSMTVREIYLKAGGLGIANNQSGEQI
jgi:hypothetical protein